MTKISSNTGKPLAQVSQGTDIKQSAKKGDSGGFCCIKFATFLILIFASAALYIYRYNLRAQFFEFRKGAQLALAGQADDFSTILCQQYDVSLGEPADVFLVDGRAHISKNEREIVSLTEHEYINKDKYAYYASYLLKDSEIKVQGCRIRHTMSRAEILVIKGDEDWESWKKGECHHCAKKRVNIKEMDVCEFHETFDLEYHVKSTDNYYIVVTQKKKSPARSDTLVFSRLTLIKTIYDLSKINEMCLGMSSCNLNLHFNAEQDIIVRFHQESKEVGNMVSTSTNCQLRVMFWAGIFGILPGGLILLMSMCCCVCCAMERNAVKQKKTAEIKQALVDHNYTINNMSPPSYETVSAPIPTYDSLA